MEERRNILDPTAQEFHPSASAASSSTSVSSPSQLHYHSQQHMTTTLLPQQISYHPYPSPSPPFPPPSLPVLPLPHQPAARVSRRAYVSHGPTEALPDNIPTRSLLLSSVSQDVTEGLVRMELEGYGGVRAVDMSRLFEEGIVTVHFYDPRSAKSAMDAIRGQHMREQVRIWHQIQQQPQQHQHHVGGGDIVVANWAPDASLFDYDSASVVGTGFIGRRAVWAQYAPEVMTSYGSYSGVGLDDYCNNGSLVVFNLDPSVSSVDLRQIFEPFGAVKETRETPSKPTHKFVEFYDTRDAGRALAELNGKEYLGRKLSIQFSRPGGNGRSNYCRKTSNIHQSFQLPPRLVGLPRASSTRSSSASSGRGGAATSPPAQSSSNGAERSSVPARRDRKSNSSSSGSSSSRQQQQLQHPPQRIGRNKNWRNQQHGRSGRASSESRFVIKDDGAMEIGGGSGGGSSSSSSSACKDTRTTVMIKNIPNKYSQKLLLNLLDSHCLQCNDQIAGEGAQDEDGGEKSPFSAYDFVYLPIDFSNKCNVGYGFVNMTTPEATKRLYNAFHSRPWEVFNSRKICQITYARLQGLEALLEHFRNSKFACDNDEYMPVLFSPPRDGKTCTDPSTVGGGGGGGGGGSSSSIENITSSMSLLRFPSTTSDDPCGSTSHDDEDDEDSNDDDRHV